MRRSLTYRAFTLIELIVVIVIIGILAAVAAVSFNAFIKNARQSAAESAATQVGKLYQGESVRLQVPIALDALGNDSRYVYAWDGVTKPDGGAAAAAGFPHMNFAPDVQAVSEFSDVYLFASSGFWPTTDTTLLPVGHQALVMERTDGGVCWSDFGASPAIGQAPLSTHCELP